jgi:hypothetical protein
MTKRCKHQLVRDGGRRDCQRPAFRNGNRVEPWCAIHKDMYMCSGKEGTCHKRLRKHELLFCEACVRERKQNGGWFVDIISDSDSDAGTDEILVPELSETSDIN